MHDAPNTTSRPADGRNAARPTVSLGSSPGRDVVSPWATTLRCRNGVDQYTRDIIDAFRVVGANVIRLKPDKKMSVGMWAHKNRGQRVFDHHGVWTATLAGCQWGVGTAATDIWGGLTVVDIDVLDDATMAWAEAYLPPTPLVVYSTRGVHCYYRSVLGATTHVGSMGPIGSDGKKHIDYKAGPGLVVGPGSYNTDKGWTYRASVEITPDLLRSLPVFDGGPEITARAAAVGGVAAMVRGDLTGMSFRMGDGRVVDGRDVPTKWTPVYCPCHPNNRNTPHANTKRVAAGVQVRCFLDNKTVLFRPAPPLQGETAAEIITPTVLADLSRPAAKEVESPRGLFRQAYWDNHIRTNRLCLGREQVLVGEGKIMHTKRRCGKRSCLWCGPHDLAVTSRLLFRAFANEQVYEYAMEKKDFEAWSKAAKRNSVGISTKPYIGGGSPYTDTIPTILKWVAFDDGDNTKVYSNVTTTRVSKRRPPRDWHPVAVDHVSWGALMIDDLVFGRKDGKVHVSMSMRTSDSVPTELPRDSEWSVMMSDVGAGTFLAAAEAHKLDVTARDARTPDAQADFDNDPKWASLAVQCRDPALVAQFHLSLVGESAPQDNTDSFALISNIFDGTPMPEEVHPCPPVPAKAGTPPEWRVPPVPYFPDLPDSFEAAVAELVAILDDLPAPVELPSTEVRT